MPNAVPIRIADAVVSQINGHSFAIGSFTAVRSSGSWSKDFKGLTDMAVDVVYKKRGTELVLESHVGLETSVPVIAVVRKRFQPSERDSNTGEVKTSAVDPLDTLLLDIAKLFIGRRNGVVLDDEPTASWSPEAITPHFGNETYLASGLYYGFVPLFFTLTEQV